MPSGGRNLERPPRGGLAEDVGQVDPPRLVTGGATCSTACVAGWIGWLVRRRFTTQLREETGEGWCAHDLDPRNERSFGGIRSRHRYPAVPGSHRCQHSGKNPPDRANAPVETKLTQQHRVVETVGRHGPACGQDGAGYGEVKGASALGQAGRGQADGDTPLRPRLAGVAHRSTHPIAGLGECGIREADEVHPGKSSGEIGLHLDHMSFDTDQSDRVRTGQGHSAHPPRVFEPDPFTRDTQDTDDVEAHLREASAVLGQPPHGKAAQPLGLLRRDCFER